MTNVYRRQGGQWLLAASIAMLIGAWPPLNAQHNTPGGTMGDNGGLNGSLSHEDLEKLGGDHQKAADESVPKGVQAARATAQAQSESLLKALQISCAIDNARLVVAGTRQLKPGAREVDARVYEVACSDGMGYLLQTQGSEQPLATSCLNAEEVRAADVAKGKQPGYFCTLPENRDVYALVSSIVAKGTGASCTVAELRWFGRGSTTHTDYSEVRCQQGTGFLLQFPQPGSTASTTVMTCTEAAQRGLKCHLTDGGPVEEPVTLETLKAALVQRGVSCTIKQFQLVGQEEQRKRYVVAYLCADQAAGMVAFIPLRDNPAPYESMDCAKAAQSGVVCSFTP